MPQKLSLRIGAMMPLSASVRSEAGHHWGGDRFFIPRSSFQAWSSAGFRHWQDPGSRIQDPKSKARILPGDSAQARRQRGSGIGGLRISGGRDLSRNPIFRGTRSSAEPDLPRASRLPRSKLQQNPILRSKSDRKNSSRLRFEQGRWFRSRLRRNLEGVLKFRARKYL